MIIHFKSIINQEGKNNVIEFKSAVETYEYYDFQVYEFREPQTNVMNRIEISKTKINIFAGSATINLELNKDIKLSYETQAGSLILTSHMHKMVREKNDINFEYSLNQGDTKIGTYNLNLKISKG